MRTKFCIAAVVASVAIMLATVSPGFSAVDQEGRGSTADAVDGSYAQIVGNGFSANSGQCVIYSALTTDFTGNERQLEAGLFRCSGTAELDGVCPGDHSFVERYNGSAYYCTTGYSFDNNTAYDATTYRTSSTSTTLTGHVNGASLDQAGFGLGDTTRAYAWGEATGGSSACPAPSRGTFNVWQRYNTSNGWHYVTSNTVQRYYTGISGPCWTASATSSTGAFNVD